MTVDFKSSDFLSDSCDFIAVFHTGICCTMQGLMQLKYGSCRFIFCDADKTYRRFFTLSNGLEDMEFQNGVLTLSPENGRFSTWLSEAEQEILKPRLTNIFQYKDIEAGNMFTFPDKELDKLWPFFKDKFRNDILKLLKSRNGKYCFTVAKADRERMAQWFMDKKKQLHDINSYPAVLIGDPSKEQEQWHPFLRVHCNDDQSQLVSFLRDKFPVFFKPIPWKDNWSELTFHVDKNSVSFHKSEISNPWVSWWEENPDSIKIRLRYSDAPLFDYEEYLTLDYFIEYLGEQLDENYAEICCVLDRPKDFLVSAILLSAQNNQFAYIKDYIKFDDTYIVKDLFGMKGYFKVTLEYWYSYTPW